MPEPNVPQIPQSYFLTIIGEKEVLIHSAREQIEAMGREIERLQKQVEALNKQLAAEKPVVGEPNG